MTSDIPAGPQGSRVFDRSAGSPAALEVRSFCVQRDLRPQSWRVFAAPPPGPARRKAGTEVAPLEGMTTTTHESVKPILSLTAIAFLTATVLALVALALG
jgi:hypothetical protein